MGVYPELTVPQDASLRITVGFLAGATGTDGALFEVWFRESGVGEFQILTRASPYDGTLDWLSTGLDSLAGRTGSFLLTVRAGATANQDWAVWAEAGIWVPYLGYTDLEITDVNPVQVVYAPDMSDVDLVKSKGTAFNVTVRSTVRVQAEFKLELPDQEWSTSPPPSHARPLPAGWRFPEIWGPVELQPGLNHVMLPVVLAGEEEQEFDPDTHPAGVLSKSCWTYTSPTATTMVDCHPPIRNLPRPTADLVSVSVTVDPRNQVLEAHEDNNSLVTTRHVVTTRGWKFLFFPASGGGWGLPASGGCVPQQSDVENGAMRQLEYLLALFPIADDKVRYAIDPFLTIWLGSQDRGTFLRGIARAAGDEGYDFAVAVGCGCSGGGTMGSWVGAAFIDHCSMFGGYATFLAHEFNHQVTPMGDVYSYRACDWDVPYCEFGNEIQNCPAGLSWSGCQSWCQGQGGLGVYGCPDGRNVIPASDGFWANRWIPISSETSPYIMDGCPAGCTGWGWMRYEPLWWCLSLYGGEGCGHHVPGGTIDWGDIGDGMRTVHTMGRGDGYLQALSSGSMFVTGADPEALLVSGEINKNGTVVFDPFLRIGEASLDLQPGDTKTTSTYYIVLFDGNGNILSRSGFNATFYQTDPNGGPVDRVPFVYRIQWSEGTKRIELQDETGNALASRTVTANSPDVRVTSPNGGEVWQKRKTYTITWEAGDRDEDALTYSVSISANGGQTWMPMSVDLTEKEYVVNTTMLVEGENYLVKVKATDGVNTAQDVSDGPFMLRLEEEVITQITTEEEVTTSTPPPRCLIATAAYGSELSPEVQFLRSFRDDSLLKTKTGSSFMVAFNAWYYSFSPTVAQLISEQSDLRTATKFMLYPLIGILRIGGEAFYLFPANPEAAAVVSGLLVSSLIGVVYLAMPLAAALACSSRARRVAKRLHLPSAAFLFGALAAVAFLTALDAPTIVMMLATSTLVLASLAASALSASRGILHLAKRV